MNHQLYNYSGFSLKKLNDPRFSHVKLLLGWVIYFAMYFITENLIPAEKCHVIHCAVDDMIPFCEYFVIIYVSWFLFCFCSIAYSLFYNVEAFKRMQVFIMITQLIAMICYIVYPSIQNLRPAVFPRQNFFTWVMGIIYAFDTPTGVCPSLHVAYSIGITSAALKDKKLPIGWKIAAVVFTLLVCMAVCFVKQHSFVDVLVAIPVCIIAEIFVYKVFKL